MDTKNNHPDSGRGNGTSAPSHPEGWDGRKTSPHANEFCCRTCGRSLNTRQELLDHQVECRLVARSATVGSRW